MGTTAKTMTGARARLIIDGKLIGIFQMCHYALNFHAAPVYILGNYAPQEITLTSQEPITVTCRGWRIIDQGPHTAQGGRVPKLQDLLRHEDISISIFDRQTNKEIMTVVGCRPIGYNTDLSTGNQQQITVTFQGLKLSDETGDQDDIGGVKYGTP
jgi:hypothetical protein